MAENNLRPLNDKELNGILETILPLLAALNAEGYCLGEVEGEDGKTTHVFGSIAEVTKADTAPTPVLPLSEALEIVQRISNNESFERTTFDKIGNMIVRLFVSVGGLEEDVAKKIKEEMRLRDSMIN